jgi:Asparagine synthase
MPEHSTLRRRGVGGESSYYYADHAGWSVSSSLGEIARVTRASVDLPVLARWMVALNEPSSRTLLSGVHRVLPCQRVTVGRDSLGIAMELPTPASKPSDLDLAKLAPILRQHIERVVQSAVEGSRCAGIMVGGLDSCGIAAVALHRNDVPIKLLTFDQQGTDPDLPYVRDLARIHGAELIVQNVQADTALVESLLLVDGLPHLAPGSVIQLVGARLLREAGADRMLTGALGDDVLGGNCEMIGTRMLREHPLAALSLSLAIRMPDELSPLQRVTNYLFRPNLRELLPTSIRTRRRRTHIARRYAWTTPAFLDLLEPTEDVQRTVYRAPRTGEELFHAYATALPYADIADACALLDTITHVRRIDVLADLELARFTSSLPFEVLNCDKTYRGLYRRALADVLPDSIQRRIGKADGEWQLVAIVKRAFESPRFQALMSLPQLTSLGWVNSVAFRQRIAEFESPDELAALWPFLSAEAFLQSRSAS